MMKFKFRLETVLKIRTIEMEQQAKILALAHKEVARARSEIMDFRRIQGEEVTRAKDLATVGKFSQAMLQQSSLFRDAVKHQEQLKMKELSELMQKAEKERLLLTEKEKKKKVLEKLKERDFENYTETARKNETKEMDELAGTRWWAPER